MPRFLPALLLAILVAPAAAADFPAKVVGVSDGDTLTVLKDGRTQVKVRLWGVDVPESGQAFGSNAKQATSDLCFGTTVTIRDRGRERYGRTLAEVVLPDGATVNRELVGQGMAWWYREYAPRDFELGRIEATAKAARRGLWADPRPVPPWAWRKGAGQSAPATAGVVGNRNSHVFHTPTCPAVRRMKPENRMTFGSAEEAERAGYRKAGDCR